MYLTHFRIDCTQLMEAFRRAGDLQSAKGVRVFMRERDIPFDARVYSTLLSLCAEVKDFDNGLVLWEELLKETFEVCFDFY